MPTASTTNTLRMIEGWVSLSDTDYRHLPAATENQIYAVVVGAEVILECVVCFEYRCGCTYVYIVCVVYVATVHVVVR